MGSTKQQHPTSSLFDIRFRRVFLVCLPHTDPKRLCLHSKLPAGVGKAQVDARSSGREHDSTPRKRAGRTEGKGNADGTFLGGVVLFSLPVGTQWLQEQYWADPQLSGWGGSPASKKYAVWHRQGYSMSICPKEAVDLWASSNQVSFRQAPPRREH